MYLRNLIGNFAHLRGCLRDSAGGQPENTLVVRKFIQLGLRGSKTV